MLVIILPWPLSVSSTQSRPRLMKAPLLRLGLCFVLFLLFGLPTAQAQVVIKERVELQQKQEQVRPAPHVDSIRAIVPVAPSSSSQIIAPKSGSLQIYYANAERYFTPIPDSAFVTILRNGEEMATDTVRSHLTDELKNIRYVYTCYGFQYIDQYLYSSPNLESALVTVGQVEKGDTLTLGYTTDSGTYGGYITPVSDTTKTAWNVDLGFYYSCVRDWGERVSLSIAIVEPEFIRQDNTPIPKAGPEATLMVSKAVTTENLPDAATFVGPPGADPDPATFRLQMTALPPGSDVKFKLEVLRDAQGVVYTHTFDAIEGTLENGTLAYRMDEHIRFVSNAPPGSAPSGAVYDDEYRGHQTIRAELGDLVRATLILDGEETDIDTELPVGRPPSEVGPNAIRTAEINFMTLDGVNSAPQTIVDRMSEDWAQAAVRFDLAGQSTITPVENALTVEGPAVSDSGMVSVEVNGQLVVVEVLPNQKAALIAYNVASAIADSTGLSTSLPPHPDQVPPGNFDRWLVIVDKGQNVTFENWSDTFANLDFNPTVLNYTMPVNETEGNVLGLNFKDDDDQTIDLFAASEVPGDTLGFAGYDDIADALPGLVNTIVIGEASADQFDDYPTVAGHEVGHVLFNKDFPGDDPNNDGHSTTSTNLMYPVASQKETYSATKRLTPYQHSDARADSGPGSDGPVLLQPKPLPNQQGSDTNDASYAKTNEAPGNE